MSRTAYLLALTQVALAGVVGMTLAGGHRAARAEGTGMVGLRTPRAISLRAPGWSTLPIAAEQNAPKLSQEANARLTGCVVTVDAYKEADDEPQHRRGTGVMATRTGYVFAPLFVVDDADFVIVNFGPEHRSPARIIAQDPHSMLAVLRASFPPRECACPVLGDDTSERIDSPVMMLSPDNNKVRVTNGSIVGPRAKVGPLSDVLEVVMPQAPGELGGVLVTAHGELIGLALATADGPESKGGVRVFALPASQIRQALARILNDKSGAPERQAALSSA